MCVFFVFLHDISCETANWNVFGIRWVTWPPQLQQNLTKWKSIPNGSDNVSVIEKTKDRGGKQREQKYELIVFLIIDATHLLYTLTLGLNKIIFSFAKLFKYLPEKVKVNNIMRMYFIRRTSGTTKTEIMVVVITDNHEPLIMLLTYCEIVLFKNRRHHLFHWKIQIR